MEGFFPGVTTFSDKGGAGGGDVIMDSSDYNNKIIELFNEKDTCKNIF